MDILARSLRDLFTPKFILLSLFPLFAGLVIFGIIFGAGIWGISQANESSWWQTLVSLPMLGDYLSDALDTNIGSIVANITSWIVAFIVSGVVAVILAMVVAGFLTPFIVREIDRRHYGIFTQNKNINDANIAPLCDTLNLQKVSTARLIALMIKALFFCIFLFFIAAILAVILLLFPVASLLAFHIPLFYIFYRFFLLDVASNALDRDTFEIYIKRNIKKALKFDENSTKFNTETIKFSRDEALYKFSKRDFFIYSFLFYCAQMIPFLGLFVQVFFIIVLTHSVFQVYK